MSFEIVAEQIIHAKPQRRKGTQSAPPLLARFARFGLSCERSDSD